MGGDHATIKLNGSEPAHMCLAPRHVFANRRVDVESMDARIAYLRVAGRLRSAAVPKSRKRFPILCKATVVGVRQPIAFVARSAAEKSYHNPATRKRLSS